VLPLQNAMRKPTNFSKVCGVLNVGMVVVTTIFVCFGFMGYLKFGEAVEGSLSLNLPIEDKYVFVKIS
jgi:proton-coupled amino acid transporter